jgi:hypothetical protein
MIDQPDAAGDGRQDPKKHQTRRERNYYTKQQILIHRHLYRLSDIDRFRFDAPLLPTNSAGSWRR